MRFILFVIFFFNFTYALTYDETKHLLNRVYFGYTKDDINKFLPLNKEQSIQLLLKQATSKKTLQLPLHIKKVSTLNGKFKNLSVTERKTLRKLRIEKMKEVSVWWNEMMLDSRFAFREKMVLFWHGLLTSEYKVVKNPYMMTLQNELYRDNAIGNFSTLIHKSSKDLAMLVYLDSNSNIKKTPNENYARELMELFTLGEGFYSEKDIKEAARAFTGYKVRKKDFIFKKVKKHHDSDMKEFFSLKGNFDGEDIINIILKQDRVSEYIVSRLYETFVKKELNHTLIKNIAKKFKDSNYDIKLVLQELLLSSDFWASTSLMIKSPIEFTLSSIKNLEISLDKNEFKRLLKVQKKLGQELFNPPSVKGWSEGEAWIDSSSLIYREKFIKYLIYKKLPKDISSKDYISSFENLNNYFFTMSIKEDIKYKKNRRTLVNYLTKLEYQIK